MMMDMEHDTDHMDHHTTHMANHTATTHESSEEEDLDEVTHPHKHIDGLLRRVVVCERR